jgi:hypothetical protein
MQLLPEIWTYREIVLKEEVCGRKSNDDVHVMLAVTEHGLLTIGPKHDFTNNTFTAYSIATCKMLG